MVIFRLYQGYIKVILRISYSYLGLQPPSPPIGSSLVTEAIAYLITISSSSIDSPCDSCSACLLPTVHLAILPHKYSLFLYMRSLSVNAYSAYLNIFLYIVIYYRLVICSLNYLIHFYMARISYYRRVIYKFKYLKSQRFGIQDY